MKPTGALNLIGQPDKVAEWIYYALESTKVPPRQDEVYKKRKYSIKKDDRAIFDELTRVEAGAEENALMVRARTFVFEPDNAAYLKVQYPKENNNQDAWTFTKSPANLVGWMPAVLWACAELVKKEDYKWQARHDGQRLSYIGRQICFCIACYYVSVGTPEVVERYNATTTVEDDAFLREPGFQLMKSHLNTYLVQDRTSNQYQRAGQVQNRKAPMPSENVSQAAKRLKQAEHEQQQRQQQQPQPQRQQQQQDEKQKPPSQGVRGRPQGESSQQGQSSQQPPSGRQGFVTIQRVVQPVAEQRPVARVRTAMSSSFAEWKKMWFTRTEMPIGNPKPNRTQLTQDRVWMVNRLRAQALLRFSTLEARPNYVDESRARIYDDNARIGGGVVAVDSRAIPLYDDAQQLNAFGRPANRGDVGWLPGGDKVQKLIQKLDQVHQNESSFNAIDKNNSIEHNKIGLASELKLLYVSKGEYASVWEPDPRFIADTQHFYPDFLHGRLNNIVIRIPIYSKVAVKSKQFDRTVEEMMNLAVAAEGGFGPDVMLAVCGIRVTAVPKTETVMLYTVVEKLPLSVEKLFVPAYNFAHKDNPLVDRILNMIVDTLFEISVRRMFHLDCHLQNFMLSCPRTRDARELMSLSYDQRFTLHTGQTPDETPQNRATIQKMVNNLASLTEQVLAIDLDPSFVRRITPDAAELKNRFVEGLTLDHTGAFCWNVLFFACLLKRYASYATWVHFTQLRMPKQAAEALEHMNEFPEEGRTLLQALYTVVGIEQTQIKGRFKQRAQFFAKYAEQQRITKAQNLPDPPVKEIAKKRPGRVGNLWLEVVVWSADAASRNLGEAFERVPLGPRTTTSDPDPFRELDQQTVQAFCMRGSEQEMEPEEYARALAVFCDMPPIFSYWLVAYHEQTAHGMLLNWDKSAKQAASITDPTQRRFALHRVEQTRRDLQDRVVNLGGHTYVFLKRQLEKNKRLVDVMIEYLQLDVKTPRDSPFEPGEFGYNNKSLITELQPRREGEDEKDWLHRFSGFFGRA